MLDDYSQEFLDQVLAFPCMYIWSRLEFRKVKPRNVLWGVYRKWSDG